MFPASSQPAEKCSECGHRKTRTFCNLGPLALASFDDIGAHVMYPGRSVLFEEGHRSNGVFVVCAGHLKLSASSREGRTMILKIAGPGDVLGLGATLSDGPYEVTAETLEPCTIKAVRRNEFVKFLEGFGEVSQHAAQSLAREYSDAFQNARRLALSGSSTGRLAQLLLDWARTAACGKPELRFTMALTHDELASMAGTSRETVTRLLNQFEREGLIERRGATLVILKPSQLEAHVR
ncbi:CRP/FNR family transcriptional regulator [Acidipila rosea]|uniref:CRP/FNR family transcriptional regulator n=2 Tax=Acidipila rosea TaxID=768535 RepID=A0A4V2PVF8_9BACT|nr:CRP/FNR family transcriptional regulator [Acidipila rosea]